MLRTNRKIGSGTFGKIYLGYNPSNGKEVAIKLEKRNASSPCLAIEKGFYDQLRHGEGMPQLYWSGIQGKYNVLIIELLGPSLEDLFIYCGLKFSLKTILMIIDQMLTRIQYMHSQCVIHRDVKPGNFVIGMADNQDTIYPIDFGLAKQFKNPKTGVHNSYRDRSSFIGTPIFGSINAHCWIEQSRRDDLESLGYMLVYFLKGSLPWQSKGSSKDDIKEKKMETSLEDLCSSLPEEIKTFIEYTRELEYYKKPDYAYLRGLILQMKENNHIEFDTQFDWVIKHNNDKLAKSKEK